MQTEMMEQACDMYKGYLTILTACYCSHWLALFNAALGNVLGIFVSPGLMTGIYISKS